MTVKELANKVSGDAMFIFYKDGCCIDASDAHKARTAEHSHDEIEDWFGYCSRPTFKVELK